MADLVLGGLILIASGLVIRKLYRDKKSGKTGCGGAGCSGCGGSYGCGGCKTGLSKDQGNEHCEK